MEESKAMASSAESPFLLFLLLTLATSVPSHASCPSKCMCTKENNTRVWCQDSTLDALPSAGLPPETEVLQIKGTYSRLSEFHHLREDDLKGLASLRSLTISHTLLDTIDVKALQGHVHLTSLDLSFNKLTKLPASVFSGLSSLAMLYLTGNQHLSLPPTIFQGLHNLKELYLGDLGLGNLDPSLFSGLDNLGALYLSSNEIKDIPTSVTSVDFLRSLQTLDLSDNKLTFLSNSTAPLFGRVARIQLNDNPWDCTCELKWLQRYTAHIFPPHHSSRVLTCHSPAPVSNRALALIPADQLICIAPQIVSCDPVAPQSVGASFQLHCSMTGQPFPFVSWKTADGAVTIGSSRQQVSPFLDISGKEVTLTLMASERINGSLTVMAQNVYGVGTENIPLLIQPTTTTSTTTTTTTTTTSPSSKTQDKKDDGGGGGEGGGGMMMYVAAGVGGAALLISAVVTAVACRKMNQAKVKVDPEKPDSRNREDKNDDVHDDDDDDGYGDDGVEEMDSGRGSVGGVRPPTVSHPTSAWDF